ncbi:MAG: tetratricopeptide repeat protein [Polyangia bacterium]
MTAITCVPASAIAAPSAGDVADAQYRNGAKEFNAKHYQAALAAFHASLELEPSPNTRFRIAQCQLLLGKVASAYLNFRRTAEEAAGRLRATNEKRYDLTRKAAILEAASVEAKVPRLTLAVSSQVPDGFRVLVDGTPLPRAAWGLAVEMDPGQHQIIAEGPRLRRYETSVELVPGEQQRVDVPLQRLATASLALLYASKPTGLAAYIDDQPLPLEQLEVRHDVDVGRHSVRVSAPGYASFRWSDAAECKGRKFYCTAHGGSQYSTAQVSCKEEQAKPENAGQAAAPPAASGCQYDAQCKGDRICQKGQCVDSEKASSARNTCRRGDSADCQAKCEGGSSASCFNLGKMYEEGDGVPVDIERMAQYFDMACKQGDMAACTNLGNKFERGLGVQADPSRAVPLYLRACGLGSSYGCAALAALYENGRGVAQDRLRASELYGKACKGGNAAGCEGAKRTAP